MMETTKKLEKIRNLCHECSGEGEVSQCCQAEVMVVNGRKRCYACTRFCKSDYCGNCNAEGWLEYKVGDEVLVFVCMFSRRELQDQLYHSKNKGDTKTFEGKIVEIVSDDEVMVKIKYRKSGLVKINVDDLEVR